ncbi:MAG TPA: colicin E3/pyocin S6 family cytotoxin [Candidatus Babeliales bacterium]|nr:colicin E3/pyocin S6 family cytotoxin [Candidatus Babeliales bacterium]
MLHNKIKALMLCYIVLCGHILLPSIISGSLIKTCNDLTPVENITIGGNLIGYDDTSLTNVTVTHVSKTTTETIVVITTRKGCVYAAPNQLFYDPSCNQWIAAQSITTNTTLLDAHLNHCSCLKVETISVPPTDVYHISTTDPHNFFVSEQELLTHNALPVIVISLAWLFGEGLKFAGITIGTAVLSSYVGVQLYNAQKQKQKCNISLHVGPCGNPCTDPDDDDNDKERVFNTISKTEFFQSMKKHYEHYKEDIYRTKTDTFGKKTKYIKWDHLHNDIEAYTKNGKHLGSINPRTLKFCKPANPRNWIEV